MGWRVNIRTVLTNQKAVDTILPTSAPEPLFFIPKPDLTDIQTTLLGLTRAQQTGAPQDAIHD